MKSKDSFRSKERNSGEPIDPQALIEKLCEQLRQALQRGETKPIEHILTQSPEHLRDQVLEELVAVETQLRSKRGEAPTWEEYAARFGDRLEAAWRGFRHYDPAISRPAELELSTHELDETDARTTFGESQEPTVPDRLGEYEINDQLGAGTFGRVFKARHASTGELVAIKQLKSRWAQRPAIIEQFLAEAQRMMRFDHPGVVRVYQLVDSVDLPYFVQEYVEGGDLTHQIRQGRLAPQEATELVIQIADALAHIHSFKLYHRDLKPANVLLDSQGKAHLADFGLALADSDRWDQSRRPTGTYLYMSPEQLHGRWHLLNPRCDIWSLGVIYYELLTGERPFQRKDFDELRREISSRVPPAPRDLDQSIPQAINRICMSCLEKQVRLRPASAADLRDDLRRELDQLGQPAETARPSAAPSVDVYPTPKLRRFTAAQADIYLRLMPRSYANPEELPELIDYWKQRIGNHDPDMSFRIGVLVGVSGCGKSSLLEAGLLPRLPDNVTAILIQGSESETEVQLRKSLQKAFPDAGPESSSWSLPEWTHRLREGELLRPGQKVLLVLDQFEQWLHAHGADPVSLLRDALQQCDGPHLQAIICVREGFHSSLMRFVDSLDVRLDVERNYATAHRFDIGHARFVLEQFGCGLGRLEGKLTPEQEKFLETAVEQLAQADQDGVRSVRLVVLALVMAHREWTVAELEQLGGLDGIGRQFLLDSFEGRTAPEQYRRLLPAAMRVLESLLPGEGLEIKDAQTYAQLLRVSELPEREFGSLLEILVRKLFLVTPVDPDIGPELDVQVASDEQRYYQLTHDFLVPSVRQWIEFKEEQSPSGRARLLLRRLSGAWTADYENRRHLPSLPEYLQIRRHTEKNRWTDLQRRMMRVATRFYGVRFSLGTTGLVALVAIGFVVRTNVAKQQEATRIQGLVGGLVNAEPNQVPEIAKELDANPTVAATYLSSLLSGNPSTPDVKRSQLHARLATVARDPSLVEPLKEELLTGKLTYVMPIRQQLRPYAATLTEEFRVVLREENDPQRRFRASLALADYVREADAAFWTQRDLQFVADQLVSANAVYQPQLWELLAPLDTRLVQPLQQVFADTGRPENERLAAANALVHFLPNDVARLAELLTVGTPAQFQIIYDGFDRLADAPSLDYLRKRAAEQPANDLKSDGRIALGKLRANAGFALLRKEDLKSTLNVLRYENDPEAMTQFIHGSQAAGIAASELEQCFRLVDEQRGPLGENRKKTGAMALYALLLALGEFQTGDLAAAQPLVDRLVEIYARDPSSGVHSASGWLLRRWGQEDEVARIDHTQIEYDVTGHREWYVTKIEVPDVGRFDGSKKKIYFTWIVFQPGDYQMGSPDWDSAGNSNEQFHTVTLTRAISVLDREVSWDQFDPFDRGTHRSAFSQEFAAKLSSLSQKLTATDPVFGVSWFEAVAWCRWLTETSGMTEADQCYSPAPLADNSNSDPGWVELPAETLWPMDQEKPGYRLLTEAEWEVVCRSGTSGSYSFGEDKKWLGKYGWFLETSGDWSHPTGQLRPNPRGLFDIHGNLNEWCYDWYGDYDSGKSTSPEGPKRGWARLYRGGAWNGGPRQCRSAGRGGSAPDFRGGDLGFRVLRSSIK